jgi:hypothetical protein
MKEVGSQQPLADRNIQPASSTPRHRMAYPECMRWHREHERPAGTGADVHTLARTLMAQARRGRCPIDQQRHNTGWVRRW